MKSHTFRGRRFDILFKSPKNKNNLAECDYEGRLIQFKPTLEDVEELDTYIHESLHAVFPDIAESAVGAAASDIAGFLWRLGYKKQNDRSK